MTKWTRCIIILFALLCLSFSIAAAPVDSFYQAKGALTEEELYQKGNDFMLALQTKEYQHALNFCSPSYKEQLYTASKNPFASIEEVLGTIISYTYENSTTDASYIYFTYKVNFGDYAVIFKVALNPQGQVAGLSTEYYQPPKQILSRIKTESITLQSGAYTLPALLTLPKNTSNTPVVILIHDATSLDMDSTNQSTKFFKDLANDLAQQDIAVLRFDRRAYRYPEIVKNTKLTLQEDLIQDVLTAIKCMKNYPNINGNQIYLYGHGLGGTIIPMIDEQTKDVAGYIMSNSPSRFYLDALEEQYTYAYDLSTSWTQEEKETNLKNLKDVMAAARKITVANPGKELGILGYPNFYWAHLKAYDPIIAAKKMYKPLLITQGERDYETSMKDYEGWQTALEYYHNASFASYPGLNHMYVSATIKSSPSEYLLGGSPSSIYVSDLVRWIKKQVEENATAN